MDRIELAVLDKSFTPQQAWRLLRRSAYLGVVAAGLFSGLILLAFGGHL